MLEEWNILNFINVYFNQLHSFSNTFSQQIIVFEARITEIAI